MCYFVFVCWVVVGTNRCKAGCVMIGSSPTSFRIVLIFSQTQMSPDQGAVMTLYVTVCTNKQHTRGQSQVISDSNPACVFLLCGFNSAQVIADDSIACHVSKEGENVRRQVLKRAGFKENPDSVVPKNNN